WWRRLGLDDMREIKVVSHHGGWLSHYFHFLIDFVHP
ncbi:unnamed protein product, partial [marine sediment metagenome]